MIETEAAPSPYCTRCLTKRSSYSAEGRFCFSCRSLYNRVFSEVVDERAQLRERAEGYQRYVGDCRPWRTAAEQLLPLLALNRLALDERAFVRGEGFPSYDDAFASRKAGLAGEPGASLWAGNLELLAYSWPLTERALERGFERLAGDGVIQFAGQSPHDEQIELWFVNAPYARPLIATELDEETGIVVRGVAARGTTRPSGRAPAGSSSGSRRSSRPKSPVGVS